MGASEVIVVGGGIVGAACAHELAREGVSVTLLEADRLGGGATAACMGHVVVMDDSEAQFALGRWSQRLWDELVPSYGSTPEGLSIEHDPCGTLWIAEDEEEMAAVRAKLAFYSERGVAAEALDGRGVAEAEPELRPGLLGALRVPGDSVIYPPAAVGWLLDRAAEHCRSHGRRLEVRRGSDVARARDGDSGGGVAELGDGSRLEADRVVVAAGSASLGLLPRPLAGHRIRPRKGHLVITDRRPGFCRHQLVELGYLKSAHGSSDSGPGGASVAFNLQPRATGQILLGSSRQLGATSPEVEPRVLARMVERGCHFVPRLGELKAIRAWTGFRPATDDHLPLIGPVPDTRALLLAAGHEGLGITTALGTARLVADRVLGRESEIDPSPYLPSRGVPSDHVAEGAGDV